MFLLCTEQIVCDVGSWNVFRLSIADQCEHALTFVLVDIPHQRTTIGINRSPDLLNALAGKPSGLTRDTCCCPPCRERGVCWSGLRFSSRWPLTCHVAHFILEVSSFGHRNPPEVWALVHLSVPTVTDCASQAMDWSQPFVGPTKQEIDDMLGAPGLPEILIISVVILLLFGKRLPGVMRSLGQSVVEFKQGLKADPGNDQAAVEDDSSGN